MLLGRAMLELQFAKSLQMLFWRGTIAMVWNKTDRVKCQSASGRCKIASLWIAATFSQLTTNNSRLPRRKVPPASLRRNRAPDLE